MANPPKVEYMGIIVPSPATLHKYGLDAQSWALILERQGWACGACGKVPKTKRLNIDHQHVRGWKNMAPLDRTRYVRGLLCWSCNSFRLARGATVMNLRGAADYLEAYEARHV